MNLGFTTIFEMHHAPKRPVHLGLINFTISTCCDSSACLNYSISLFFPQNFNKMSGLSSTTSHLLLSFGLSP